MKIMKSQQGMILFLAIFIIVFFSIIGIAIISFTVTNAKQTNHIEVDMQSVDVAEMGIIRYQNELIVKMENVLTKDIQDAITAIETENNNVVNSKNANKEYTAINKENVIKRMKAFGAFSNTTKYQLGFNPSENFIVKESPNFFYRIEEMLVDTSNPNFPEKIVIDVKSVGVAMDKTSEVTASFSFDIGKMIETHLVAGKLPESTTSSNELVSKPPMEFVENGKNLPTGTCNGNLVKGTCWENSFKGNLNVNQGDLDASNLKLYALDGNLTFGTIKNISSSKLYANGDVIFNNSNNGGYTNNEISSNKKITFGTMTVFENNTLYAKGDITFNHFNSKDSNAVNKEGIVNSRIYSETGAVLLNHLNTGIKDSFIYAGSYVELGGLNSQGNITNTKMYVNGYLKIGNIDALFRNGTVIWVNGDITATGANGQNGKIIDHTSYICAKGKISNNLIDKVKGTEFQNNIREKVSSFENCGGPLVIKESTPSTLNPIIPSIMDAINDATYTYH